MELYAKGQLSFLILNCLLERDFYGLDIISEISARSNGRINLKKPSVYSNLTRMEKQSLVSSYLKSSDLGPNRKYYSITEKGRNFYNDLNDYFNRNNIDVFRDFSDENELEKVTIESENIEIKQENPAPVAQNEISEQNDNNSDENLNDYFDFSSFDEEKTTSNQTVNLNEKVENENELTNNEQFEQEKIVLPENNLTENTFTEQTEKVNETVNEEKIDNQEDIIEENVVNEQENQEVNNIPEPDDAVFLSNDTTKDYNQRIYDISKDFKNYKRKKSFAEDQIAINNTSSLYDANEKTENNIETFKAMFNETKSNIHNENAISQYDFSRQMQFRNDLESEKTIDEQKEVENKEETNEEVKDDGKIITQRLSPASIRTHAKKIEPPKIKVLESARSGKLPAPIRDKSIDPSHKEILSRLYSKTKDDQATTEREDAIYDYVDLKDYYSTQNIAFNEYNKDIHKHRHNTNKLYFIISLLVFGLSSILSAALFTILHISNQLNATFNFLYIVLPLFTLAEACYRFYNYRKYSGWLPDQMMKESKMWVITLVSTLIIVALNVILGLGYKTFDYYSTTLILPILLIFTALPVKYYLKRVILVKFWR